MTRLTSDERAAILAEIDAAETEAASCMADARRLRSMLDSQPDGSDGDTIRLLQPLCSCGLPRDHRHPRTGEPRPCADETARIAGVDERRGRPPVPGSVARDESAMTDRAADAFADLVVLDMELRGDLEDGHR